MLCYEGSLGERATLLHGAGAAGAMKRSGIAFTAVANGGLTRAVGEPLEIELSATGLGADDTLSARLEVFASSYTGLASAQLGAQTFDALPARLMVPVEAYKDHLADTSFCFEMRAYARVDGKGPDGAPLAWAEVTQVYLAAPELQVPVRVESAGALSKFIASFTNPLPFALGTAELSFSAPRGLTASVERGNGQQIGAHETAEFAVTIQHDGATPIRGPSSLISLELDTPVLTDVPASTLMEWAADFFVGDLR